MPETLIGLVFSSFEFCIFAFSPIFGSYITQIGPRFAFIAGQFLAGGCSILFGLLYMSPAGVPFIALCFALRIVKAVGAAAYVTASFTIIANEFPAHVATAFAGGFGLPFFLMGGLLILCSLANYFTLAAENDSRGVQPKRRGSMLRLFRSPLILVSCLCVVLSMYTFGFMDASLSTHLEQFHLSAVIVGLLFMIIAGLYSISSPMFGWLSDKKGIVFPFLLIGNIVTTGALLIMGPSPLLPFERTELWMIVVGLMLLGLSVGASAIPSLKCFYIGARRLGFRRGLELDGLVAGLLNSSFHFGTFLGPTIGSPVMQAYSYEWSLTLNAALCLFAAILLCTYLTVERLCLHYDENENIADDRADTTLLIESHDGNTRTANYSTSSLTERTENKF